jgi:hypothetical protein
VDPTIPSLIHFQAYRNKHNLAIRMVDPAQYLEIARSLWRLPDERRCGYRQPQRAEAMRVVRWMIFRDVLVRSFAQANLTRLKLSPQDGVDQINRQRAEVNGRIGFGYHGVDC